MEGAPADGGSIIESTRTVVVRPHHATDESQLELQINEIVYVLEQDATGWWGGHKEGEDTTGWFPGTCVRLVLEPGHPALPQADPHGGQAAAHNASMEQPSASLDEGSVRTEGRGMQGHLDTVVQAVPAVAAVTTDHRSPVRRRTLVASPQRAEMPQTDSIALANTSIMTDMADGEPAAAFAIVSGASNVRIEALEAENIKLKRENSELSDTLRRYQRQSDVDRRSYTEMELAAQRERERVERLEEEYRAESAEKSSLSTEARDLRSQLEREKEIAQAQHEATETMRLLYEGRLKDKTEELRTYQDNGRKSIASERQRARLLEEQLRSCQEEIMSVRREQRDSVVSGAGQHGTADGASGQDMSVLQGNSSDDTRRRLFSSIMSADAAPLASPHEGSRGTSSSNLLASGAGTDRSDMVRQYEGQAPMVSPTAGFPTDASTRGRSHTSPAGPYQPQPSPPGTASRPAGHRPPEPPRSASSAPRPEVRCRGAAPVSPGLGHAHSMGDLVPRRPASPRGNGEEVEDAPPRGCVAEKVSVFEQRCRSQTPRRDNAEAYRGLRNEGGRFGRNSRFEDRAIGAAARPLPAYVPPRAEIVPPRSPAASAAHSGGRLAPRPAQHTRGGLGLSADVEEAGDEQVFTFGMSPIHPNRSPSTLTEPVALAPIPPVPASLASAPAPSAAAPAAMGLETRPAHGLQGVGFGARPAVQRPLRGAEM
mmetsp:Transcript_75199/g.212540  ORF Transcript_75199/g.212540 Transcript_75199/m.212540 type:complete len:711 (-) Transcript_75199:131-2263(-)